MSARARAVAYLFEFLLRFEPLSFERLQARLDIGLLPERLGQPGLHGGLIAGRIRDERV